MNFSSTFRNDGTKSDVEKRNQHSDFSCLEDFLW